MDSAPPSTEAPPTGAGLSRRQIAVRAAADRLADELPFWRRRSRYFHDADAAYMRFLIPEGSRVLEIGCGDGDLLAALKPAYGVGVDLSPAMIDRARAKHPHLTFHVGDGEDPADMAGIDGIFDVIVLSDTIGYLDDCEECLTLLRRFAGPRTRLAVSYRSRLWEPALQLAERLKIKMPQGELNYLSSADIGNLLQLAGWEPVKREWRVLFPWSLFGLGGLINRWIAPLPLIRRLCLRNYMVGRPAPTATEGQGEAPPSVTVLVPCRNERGNIESAVSRLPAFAPDIEVIYVEGHSVDGTYEECLRVRDAYPHLDIKVMRQPGKGKGDAVRAGFAAARGDILMILDADLTVPPETLPKFYRCVAAGRGEFVNGTRLVYPMESGAMRLLNYMANRAFAWVFSFLLNQRFTDTLCGTKVLWRSDYQRIADNRRYFGDFDPFGDFDLIFGAAKLNLKITELPVRYMDRTYGTTQISRFRHGFLLLRMVAFAWRKLKAL
jgi:SAM-dependent methyltransferase